MIWIAQLRMYLCVGAVEQGVEVSEWGGRLVLEAGEQALLDGPELHSPLLQHLL
jgi:hypothetical protein